MDIDVSDVDIVVWGLSYHNRVSTTHYRFFIIATPHSQYLRHLLCGANHYRVPPARCSLRSLKWRCCARGWWGAALAGAAGEWLGGVELLRNGYFTSYLMLSFLAKQKNSPQDLHNSPTITNFARFLEKRL